MPRRKGTLNTPQKIIDEIVRKHNEGETIKSLAEKYIWLERNGIYCNPKTVLRVMQKYGLLSVIRRKKYRNYGEYLHKYPNLLNRDFLPKGQIKNGLQIFHT